MIDRRFGLEELGEADGDAAKALETGRWLEEAFQDETLVLNHDFVDRIIGAVVEEPTPGAMSFLTPLRRGIRGIRESVVLGWATARGAGRPPLGRVAALAYVLAVSVAGVSLTGVAAVGAVNMLGVFQATQVEPTPRPSPRPSPTIAPPSVAPSAPIVVPPSVAPSTGPSVRPSPTPSESPEGSDDHGGNSGPGGGDDSGSDDAGSGSGSGSGSSGSGSGSSGSGGSGSG